MDLAAFPFATARYALPAQPALRLSTGCRSIDQLLGGGVCTGHVTEVYGAQGSGKTQLAYSLIGAVTRDSRNTALLIDTDGSFVRERLCEVGANPDRVHVLRLTDADEILACLPVLLPSILSQIENVRLVVLDSFSFIARNCSYDAAMRRLYIFIDRLAHIALTHNLALLVTNDVKALPPDAMLVADDSDYPVPPAALGDKWATMCATRLALATNRDDERYAVLLAHPRLLGGRALFTITSAGITDRPPHAS